MRRRHQGDARRGRGDRTHRRGDARGLFRRGDAETRATDARERHFPKLRFFADVSDFPPSDRGEKARRWPLDEPSRLASASTTRTTPTFLVAVQSAHILCVPSVSFFKDRFIQPPRNRLAGNSFGTVMSSETSAGYIAAFKVKKLSFCARPKERSPALGPGPLVNRIFGPTCCLNGGRHTRRL